MININLKRKKTINYNNSSNMLNKTNTKIILMTIVLLVVLIPTWFFSKKEIEKHEKKINTEEKSYETFAHTDPGIIAEETYEGLKFTNISLITDKGYTTFTADVTNTNQSENKIKNVYIDLKDKDNKIIISLKGNLKLGLKSNEKDTITTKARGEFKNVVSKTIRKYES